jgi:hypothetical protein
MVDKWLDALKKTENASRVPPTPVADPLLTAMFGAAEDDVLIAPEKMDKVLDDGSADVSDPVAHLFEKNAKDKLRIPEFAAPHADGTELEKVGNQVWKHTWQNGALIKSELNGVIVTDESSKPLFITDEMAKFLGYGENNQHSDVGLVGWTPGSAA